VGSIIRNPDCFILTFIRDNRENRAKNLLARDCHVIANVREHRRSHEVSMLNARWTAWSSCYKPRALLYSHLDDSLYFVELSEVGERAKISLFGKRIARREAFRRHFRNVDRFSH